MTLLMRGTSSSRRQTVIIGAVLFAAVAVPKALAADPITVPVDGAALAAVAISASTPVVPEAPIVPIVPETGAVSPVTPVIPPAVSPAPPSVPPTPGSPAGTPQSLAGEPAGGGAASVWDGVPPGVPAIGKTPDGISGDITKKKPVILHRSVSTKPVQNARTSCFRTASCKTPEPYPRGAAAASVRGRARELPSLGVTAAELARGRSAHHGDKPRRSKPAREHMDAGGAEGPVPLIPEPPGRSPEAPPPSALTFSSQGAHGTGSFTVSASVTAFGVPAARAPTTAARSPTVQLRRRESDERIDRPG
jgi:hypothetical protein